MKIRKLKRNIAVSTIVANVLMIAITLSLAAILVAWAGTSFGAFSGGSQLFFAQRGQALQERFVIEVVFFNIAGSNTMTIFVRNVGVIDIKLAAIYVNGNPPTSNNGTLPYALGVQQVVRFNMGIPAWTTGTVFTVVVASARGNQAVATARGP